MNWELDWTEKARAQRALVTDSEAMEGIHRLLDGTEWDSDTMSQVAEIVAASGRPIRDPADIDGTPTDGRLK